MNQTILVVDDEPQIRKFLRISLGANGYEVQEAENGAQGIAGVRDASPDLLILDLGLPDQDGQEVITAVRQISDLPIIVLSVRSHEFDKVEALERGANDYVVKPFGVAELIARVRAALRSHSPRDTAETVSIGPFQMDFSRRIISRSGEEIRLSKRLYS